MYHVSSRSCKALTIVAFFILSSVTPYASHIAFTMNQKWSGSSFPNPFNTDNFIALTILNYGGGRGGMCGIHCFIKLIMLLGETFVSSSSLSHGGEIKGLDSSSMLPSFL